MKGVEFWLTRAERRPDMFVAVDVRSDQLWYGDLRIDMMKFHFSAPAVRTLHSRHAPSPAKAVARAIEAVYAIPLPPLASDVGTVRPAIATGTLIAGNDHQLDEYAEASSIVPGIKQLISLAVALTTH